MRCSSAGHGNFSWNRVLNDACVRPSELSQDTPSCPQVTQPTIGTFSCSMNAEHGQGYNGEHCILTCPAAYKLAKIRITKFTADETQDKNANGSSKTKLNASRHKNALKSIDLL